MSDEIHNEASEAQEDIALSPEVAESASSGLGGEPAEAPPGESADQPDVDTAVGAVMPQGADDPNATPAGIMPAGVDDTPGPVGSSGIGHSAPPTFEPAEPSSESVVAFSESSEPISPPEPEPASASSVATEEPQPAEHYYPSLSEGDVIKGTVVHIDREGVLVDVGTKSEGIIRRNELSRDTSTPAEDIVKVGEKIDVYVMETESQDGNLILSKKRADFEKAWERVQEAKEQGKTLHAMVTDRVKGGLVVDLGIRGFVPASHVGNGSMKNNLERYVGQSISLKVIEVDKERRKVVLSNKLAADEDRQARKQETVQSLSAGQIRHGTVRRLTNYGAFVDLGGIDGLLHISEMSWTRINHPSEVLKEGQEIDVVILKMDLDQGRVSLGLRQIQPDPWTGLDQRYHVGDIITGKVTRIVPFGAFVQVEGGIEGIIPNSELASRKVNKATNVVQQGADVEVKVIDMRPDERKMTLSLRQARPEPEPEQREPREPREPRRRDREPAQEYQATQREEPRYTIGDAFRAQQEAQAAEAADDDEE